MASTGSFLPRRGVVVALAAATLATPWRQCYSCRQKGYRQWHRFRRTPFLDRITVDPGVFGGKPIIRGRRLAVEHVLGMLAAGDSVDDLLREHPWLERDDVQACLVYARRLVDHERVEPAVQSPGA